MDSIKTNYDSKIHTQNLNLYPLCPTPLYREMGPVILFSVTLSNLSNPLCYLIIYPVRSFILKLKGLHRLNILFSDYDEGVWWWPLRRKLFRVNAVDSFFSKYRYTTEPLENDSVVRHPRRRNPFTITHLPKPSPTLTLTSLNDPCLLSSISRRVKENWSSSTSEDQSSLNRKGQRHFQSGYSFYFLFRILFS